MRKFEVLLIISRECTEDWSDDVTLLTYPGRPVVLLLLLARLSQLVDVGDPLEAVAAHEDGHDDETDLRQLQLLLPLLQGGGGQTLGQLLLLNKANISFSCDFFFLGFNDIAMIS